MYALEPAKPLHDAQMCGSFYFYTMSNRIPFQKPYTCAHDLVSLLQSRGMTIADTVKAESYLEYIGYYRLSAYMYPLLQMPKEQHCYKPNTTFSQVMMLYRFDKKIRLLIFNEIGNSGKSPWLTNQAEVKPTRPRATQIAFKTEGCLPWTKTNCAWIYSMLGLYQSK